MRPVMLLLVAVALFGSSAPCRAGDEPATAGELLEPHGVQSFPKLYVQALETFLELERLYALGQYEACRERLDRFWQAHPPGSRAWSASNAAVREVFVGSPPCYYALRMLTDCVDWRLKQPDEGHAGVEQMSQPADVRLTIVLVGRGEGIEPRSMKDLRRGKGRKKTSRIAPELLQHDNQVIHESLALFGEYVAAMTEGRLRMQTSILPLSKLDVPLATGVEPNRHAGLADEAMLRIWAAVDERTQAETDWWWVIYPSHVPESAEFETTEFITGGMGVGPDGSSPCFIVDDRWLLRKPPHLGAGPYTAIERRAYLPQWLQHEFFHHLFRTWPEFELEEEGHQWFDRSTWPSDFEGQLEPDYYHEALHRRLRPQARPPMHVALRYRLPDAQIFERLELADLVGEYVHEPTENDWHVGEITVKGSGKRARMRWQNKAGVGWKLEPDLASSRLRTGSDNPYFDPKNEGASDFRIVLERDADGDWLPRAKGFRFLGGLYTLRR